MIESTKLNYGGLRIIFTFCLRFRMYIHSSLLNFFMDKFSLCNFSGKLFHICIALCLKERSNELDLHKGLINSFLVLDLVFPFSWKVNKFTLKGPT